MSSPGQLTSTTSEAEGILNDLAEALAIPLRLYELADGRYKSVRSWLARPQSTFAPFTCNTYPQGSFSLGTVVRPWLEDDEYDLDIAFEVMLSKAHATQKNFKAWLGTEMASYAKAHSMQEEIEKQRCWRLPYAEEAKFHMDVVPAVPDAARQRSLFESFGIQSSWVDTAVSITDTEHEFYEKISEQWPLSNPKGYSQWFRSRMRGVFDARRKAIALAESILNAEDVPHYKVRTPLQSAILILKRHRDARFEGNLEDKPISVILTTLSALAYDQEITTAGALYGILERMDSPAFIKDKEGVAWIENPTNTRENFADKWEKCPARKDAFYDWLETARADFRSAASLNSLDALVDALAPRIGRPLLEEIVARRKGGKPILERSLPLAPGHRKLRAIKDAPHKKPLLWPEIAGGVVRIREAVVTEDGFRSRSIKSDSEPLRKRCEVKFIANTNVSQPLQVYWQVVNTGDEAKRAKDLRGAFHEGYSEVGELTRTESTKYQGSHSIECFIVKEGYCVARSGPFIVNIR